MAGFFMGDKALQQSPWHGPHRETAKVMHRFPVDTDKQVGQGALSQTGEEVDYWRRQREIRREILVLAVDESMGSQRGIFRQRVPDSVGGAVATDGDELRPVRDGMGIAELLELPAPAVGEEQHNDGPFQLA